MNKATVLGVTLALLAAGPLSAFAHGKSADDICKGLAAKHHVTSANMAGYMKKCVALHTAKKASATNVKTAAPATPATPASPAGGTAK